MTGQWPIGDDRTDSDWEWVDSDGLTDTQREAAARRYAETIGAPLTPEDIERIHRYVHEGLVPVRKMRDYKSILADKPEE